MVCSPPLPKADPSELPPWTTLRPEPGSDPIRWIFYTSGTTAHPKGTLHTDRTVGAAALRLNRRFEMTEDDRNALVFPVTHIGGISWLMGGLMAGYREIMVEAFDPVTSCAVLRRNGVTIAGSGPAFWMAYVAEQRRDPTIRAENVSGVIDTQYWVGGMPGENAAMPPEAAALLNPYREVRI